MQRAIISRLAALWLASACMAFGQSTNSGDIRGSVTDASGAAVPGATVTVLNVDKNVSKDYITNNDGIYDTNSIVPDRYTVTFTKQGFQTLVRGPITVDVGITPVNGALTIGGVEQKIVVTTDVPLLRTETSEQSTVLESKTMAELPNVGQDWEVFIKQLPGAQNATNQPSGFFGATGAGQVASVNGNLPFSNVLADGASTTLPASANSDISTFEIVQEVQIATSTFSAQYGVGGIIYNQISKSGTDRFHGTLYDYFQNSALNSATYAINGGTRAKNLAALRYNNFGGSIGGPVIPKKMFFYFNYDKLLQNGTANQGVATVPTAAMLAGDFTGQPTIYDPATTKVVNGVITRQSFADEYGNGNKIPASRLDPVAKAIQAYYPQACAGCGTITNGQVSNNYSYNSPNPKGFAKYFGRIDYDVRPTNRLTASVSERDQVTANTVYGICPIACYTLDVNGYNAQISDVWTVSPTFINEGRLAYTVQLNFFNPQSLGEGYPAKVGWQFAKADVFPDVQIQGSTCCLELRPNVHQTLKVNVFDPSDTVTMTRGKHILRFGGEFEFSQLNETSYNNINGGTMAYTGVYSNCPGCTATTGVGGVAYADYLLGLTRSWSANVTPQYGARIKIPQMFVQDDYKLRPNLTLNLGLRYQIQRGWNEIRGNMAVFDPAVTNPATNTLGAYWYGTTKANGRSTLQAPVYSTFLPRVGFAYGPNPKMSIRGGWGIYAYIWSQDDYGNGLGGAFGGKGSITDSTGYNPVTVLSSNGSTLPFVNATTDPAAFNGQNVSGNLYHAPVPKIYQWNFAVQEQVTSSMVAEVAYVASHGFNLQFPVDINQVPEGKLGAGDAIYKPYPQYGQIINTLDNATSNYNSLQTSIQQRLTHGLSMNFNYVWSHFLDVQDSSGWGGRSGGQVFQRSYSSAANYGNSNFDVRNSFKGTVLYQLPFGRGRKFLNKNALLDEVIGGWQLSSIFQVQNGNPFTPVISNGKDASLSLSTGASGYALFPNLIGNPIPANRSRTNWINACTILSPGVIAGPTGCTPAWAVPAAGTFGNAHRNSLVNPKVTNTNLSLGKTFDIYESVKFQLRADVQNAFNHPIFAFGNTVAVDGGTSVISNVVDPGRNVQIGAKLTF